MDSVLFAVIFDDVVRGGPSHQVFQLGDGARFPQDDQGVAPLDLGLGMRVEHHLAMPLLDADDDHADLLAEAGADQGFACKGRVVRDGDLFHLQVHVVAAVAISMKSTTLGRRIDWAILVPPMK